MEQFLRISPEYHRYHRRNNGSCILLRLLVHVLPTHVPQKYDSSRNPCIHSYHFHDIFLSIWQDLSLYRDPVLLSENLPLHIHRLIFLSEYPKKALNEYSLHCIPSNKVTFSLHLSNPQQSCQCTTSCQAFLFP